MKVLAATALLAVLAVTVEAQANAANAAASNVCTVTIQFDNDLGEVSKGKNAGKILQVLAQKVFLVPVSQVKQVSALGQSGIISSQSVLSYQATGPTTNGKSPCANCNANNKRQTLGLRNSVLESEIQKTTDTWWPNDKADVQKAECKAA